MSAAADRGSAVIEFVFVAILVLVPLVYVVVAVATIQRSTLAVTQAAREAGRAFATADSTASAVGRAQVAVRLALADQGLPDDADVRYVPVGAACDGNVMTPELAAGAEFTICIVRHAQLPGVPTLLSGRGVTAVGSYVLHVDDYRVVTAP
jgi:Flp pilus assembly protein TadG